MTSKARFAAAAGLFLSMPLGAAAEVPLVRGGRRSCRRIASPPLVLEEDDQRATLALRLLAPPPAMPDQRETGACETVLVSASLVDGEGATLKKARLVPVSIRGGTFFEFDFGEFETQPDAISVEVEVLPTENDQACGAVEALATLQVIGASGRILSGLECVGKATRRTLLTGF